MSRPWLIGSSGNRWTDALSDIDLWIVVADEHASDIIDGRLEYAARLGEIVLIRDRLASRRRPRHRSSAPCSEGDHGLHPLFMPRNGGIDAGNREAGIEPALGRGAEHVSTLRVRRHRD
ncbi:MAG: hypothetical protein ACR2JC_04585 [Chloroflexota bacterium]|nr:MAG: hypothetical protein DLM70_17910 [Chloroflexota bacterium]